MERDKEMRKKRMWINTKFRIEVRSGQGEELGFGKSV